MDYVRLRKYILRMRKYGLRMRKYRLGILDESKFKILVEGQKINPMWWI